MTARGTADFANSAARRAGLALVALYLLVYLLPLGVRPVVSPDEARYAEIPREIIVTGDWVSPHFNGLRYFEKPIMGYWLNAASFLAFGENAFALRLPSALAAGLTALIIFLLTARFSGRRSAYLAAGIYLTSAFVAGVGTLAVLDTFLQFFLTGSIASFYVAYREQHRAKQLTWLAVSGAFCAGAFLVKGFLALAVPLIVVGAYLLLRRDWRSMGTMPWLPISVAVVLVAPWALLIALREPDFWHYFFWVEHVRRFLSDDAQHSEPFWYFIARPYAALPWIVLLPAAIIGLRSGSERNGLPTYAAIWALLPFLFFSASRGKLITYILPCFAPFSIVLAVGLERYLAAGRKGVFRAGTVVLIAVLALAVAGLVAAQSGAFGAPLFAANEQPRFFFAFTFVAIALVAAIVAFRARASATSLVAVGAVGLALFMPFQLALLPQYLLDSRAPSGFLADAVDVAPDTILISDAELVGAVSWSFKRSDVYLIGKNEFAYGLEYPEARQRSFDMAALGDFIEHNDGKMVIVVRDTTVKNLPAALLTRAQRSQRGNVVILRL